MESEEEEINPNLKPQRDKGFVLVPENDTHKQTITDVYKIYKTSFKKEYDSDEDLFYTDVTHHLEMNSASTFNEIESRYKYLVEDASLKSALNEIPRWETNLPKNFGTNVCTSLSCRQIPEESPLAHLDDMGIKVIEYVKLKIGYTYLKINLNKILAGERYTSTICPGLSGGFEDPIVLRMLHMQYINKEDYLRWVLRSRKKDDTRKQEVSDEDTTLAPPNQFVNEVGKGNGEFSGESVRETIRSVHSYGNIVDGETRNTKDELPPPNAEEKRVIKLTQYEVMDQELPDDIEIFWPGKRDLENDYVWFINALQENLLYQEFIQKYKSGKLEQLDDDAKADAQQFFVDGPECKKNKSSKFTEKGHIEEKTKESFKCNFERLKHQFKDYKITQDYTLSLFENMSKEKLRLEDLNLCCIVSKLKDLHKESPDGNKDGELIWRDVVVIKTKSKEQVIIGQQVGEKKRREEKKKEAMEEKCEEKHEENEFSFPEYKSMIYVTKVYPDPGRGFMEDKCQTEREKEYCKKYDMCMRGGCTGYSMKDYKAPSIPHCSFKIATSFAKPDEQCHLTCKPKKTVKRSVSDLPDEHITMNTNWSSYPYAEILDMMHHRHHKGYVYMMDKFEIAPDTHREIERIFQRAGKYSEKESKNSAINSFMMDETDDKPACCKNTNETPPDSSEQFDFPFPLLTGLKHYVEESLTAEDLVTVKQPVDEKATPITWTQHYIALQNLEIQKENGCLGEEDSSDSTSTESNDYPMNPLVTTTSQMSSVNFSSHRDYYEEDEMEYHAYDYIDSFSVIDNPTLDEEDDYSDIVDFIKNYKFDEEASDQIKNYESTNEAKNTKEKGLFVDMSSLNTCELDESYQAKYDEVSINTEDTSSLKDIKGLTTSIQTCKQNKVTINPPTSQRNQIPPRKNYCVHGIFFDALIDKRRSIIQELRTSFPLVYLYLTLELDNEISDVSGKLWKYKKHFDLLENEYKRIISYYKVKDISQELSQTIFGKIHHEHLIYKEITQKNVIFNEEIYSMVIYNPYIRHLFIREAFQDIGTNLSYFLLHFIENDKYIRFSRNHNYSAQMSKEVGRFLVVFRLQKEYKPFLKEMIILHYFQTKQYYTINDIVQLDCNWEQVLKNPRKLLDTKRSKQIEISLNYKDSTIHDPTQYSYLFYNLIKQFNNNLYLSDLFKQFIEPDLHPKCLRYLTHQQLTEMVEKDCKEWCDTELIEELDNDLNSIMNVIWESEIVGVNRCSILINQIKNRFATETGFYFRFFFPNIIVIKAETQKKSNESESSDENVRKLRDIWMYNREFKYWYNQISGKTVLSDDFLKNETLFKFERLLTKCMIRYIVSFYDYRIHG